MPVGTGLIGPRKAVSRALADYLGGVNGPNQQLSAYPGILVDSGRAAPYPLVRALDDWPELDVRLSQPTVTVTPVHGVFEAHSLGLTYLYNDTNFPLPASGPGPGNGYILAKLGEYRFPLQLDLWADTLPDLDALERSVEEAMNSGFLNGGNVYGLQLNVGPSYFNRTAIIAMREDRDEVSSEQAIRDERRRLYICDASIEWVQLVALPFNRATVVVTKTSEAPLPPPGPNGIQVVAPQ